MDPNIETVVCGSSDPRLPSYPKWDRAVLDGLASEVNYISVHRYPRNLLRNTTMHLRFGLSLDRQLEEMNRFCLEAQQRTGGEKRMYVSFDEWNVWYRNISPVGWGRVAPPLLEETYNLEDALVVGQFLNSFIRHADFVKIANLAQIVNVIAPIRTRGNDLLRQSIFYAFRMYAHRRDGVALRVNCAGPGYAQRQYSW